MGEPGTTGSGSSANSDSGGTGSCGGGGGSSSSSDSKKLELTPEERSEIEHLDPELVAAMTADELKRFIDTGRTGRRNALPDVSQPDVVTTSTAGVAEAMESLSMQNNKEKSSTDAGS